MRWVLAAKVQRRKDTLLDTPTSRLPDELLYVANRVPSDTTLLSTLARIRLHR